MESFVIQGECWFTGESWMLLFILQVSISNTDVVLNSVSKSFTESVHAMFSADVCHRIKLRTISVKLVTNQAPDS